MEKARAEEDRIITEERQQNKYHDLELEQDDYERLKRLQTKSLIENAMEDKQRPEKRRKLENDKDGVAQVPARSPRVVLNKIKLKEDVLERLRRIKKVAQDKVKNRPLSTGNILDNKDTDRIADQEISENSEREEKPEDNGSVKMEKRKRKYDKEEQEECIKLVRVDSDAVVKETDSQSDDSVAERVAKVDQNIPGKKQNQVDRKDSLVSEMETVVDGTSAKGTDSDEQPTAIAIQKKGEVIKAAQDYAKTGAQTDPKQDELLAQNKLVVVVTEVLEEGNNWKDNGFSNIEKQNQEDDNNQDENEEIQSNKDTDDEQGDMTDAVYQLIKDVIKRRAEHFENALLQENQKLEKKVTQLEKQNAILQRFSYHLDSSLKEITKKREQAKESRVSRGTQVNMNLYPSRSSPIKSTTIQIDVPQTLENKASLPHSTKSTSSSMEKSQSPLTHARVQSTTKPKQSPIQSETPDTKVNNANKTIPLLNSGKNLSPTKPGENGKNTFLDENKKGTSESETVLMHPMERSSKVSIDHQDVQSYKTAKVGMGHFRLSPNYKRTAQQQSTTEDTSETGHYRITPTGLKIQSKCSSQRMVQGPSLVKELLASSTTTKKTGAYDLEERSQISSTSPVSKLSKVAKTLSPSQSTHVGDSSPQYKSTDKLEGSQRKRKESVNDDEPEIMIVSYANKLSPKSTRSDQHLDHFGVSPHRLQDQVCIQRVENQPINQPRPQVSNTQTIETVPQTEKNGKTSTPNIQQNRTGANHQSSSANQQIAYQSHEISRANTAPRDNVAQFRPGETQQPVRYIIQDDRPRDHIEQARQADKTQRDSRQPPNFIIQQAQGQTHLVEQALRPSDKMPPPGRYDPKQHQKYVTQEGRLHEQFPRAIAHEGPVQLHQPIPHQQALPSGAVVVQQHRQLNPPSIAGNKTGAPPPAPPPIGIQDVRTQPPQPYPTQQQQHIIVKQHASLQNSQHPYQYQQTSYQYQQVQHRPTQPQHRPTHPQLRSALQAQHRPALPQHQPALPQHGAPQPQQQNAAHPQTPPYYQPHTLKQAPPATAQHTPPAYQAVRTQEYAPHSRMPGDKATGSSHVPVGGHPSQPPPEVVYQQRSLEGTNVRSSTTISPNPYDRYRARSQQIESRQPQANNQGNLGPSNFVGQSMPRSSNHGGARCVPTHEQQRITERRPPGQTPKETIPSSTMLSRRDSVPQQLSPPKPTASIAIVENGIVLSWNITTGENHSRIDCYELFACQDDSDSTLPPILWKKIGVVKALPLPMACTLTQFSSGSRYQFAVRAVDTSERAGPFSDPCVITLKR